MNVPQFTAEASLSTTTGRYRMVGTPRNFIGGGTVLPQLMKSAGFCMADCDYTTSDPLSNMACKFDCMEGGGGGGPSGPSGPSCRPSCGPCIDGTRLCVRADCETVERPCGPIGGRRLT
jgi:hypothetical protein